MAHFKDRTVTPRNSDRIFGLTGAKGLTQATPCSIFISCPNTFYFILYFPHAFRHKKAERIIVLRHLSKKFPLFPN
uniref:Uncharacterized protein n=1 Tax=Octopus bimaculoides TaxID=37653 RepID=A0A0L8FIS2_OCTBM